MDRHARFWNRIAPRYSRAAIGNQEAYQKKLEMTRACFTAQATVLEVGCGTGSTALLHAPYVKSVLATDFAEGMIGIARERAAEAGVDNVRFEVAALESLADRDERFDVVLALNVLHLVVDLDAALASIVSLLKPGGALVASTACIGDSMPFMRFVLPPAQWLGLVPHVAIFGEERLTEALERAGLTVEMRYAPDSGRAPAVFQIARCAN